MKGFACLCAALAVGATSAPVGFIQHHKLRASVLREVNGTGITPVPAEPAWANFKETTFKVSGAGDPDFNGCYEFQWSQTDPPSVMYIKGESSKAFLTFGPAHQCSVAAEETGGDMWGVCDPGRIGWFLSKLKCIQ